MTALFFISNREEKFTANGMLSSTSPKFLKVSDALRALSTSLPMYNFFIMLEHSVFVTALLYYVLSVLGNRICIVLEEIIELCK